MAEVAYLQRRVRADDIGGAFRAEYAIPGMPGISIVQVQYDCGVSENTVSLDGIRYLTIDEAAAAWRIKRQADILHDVVANALHRLMLGPESMDWETMPAGTKQGWRTGAETFLSALNSLGMHVIEKPKGD